MHLVHEKFTLQLINLDSHEKQAMGFQFCDKIPTSYGLFFPRCGNSGFHMVNVGDDLLLIGIDDKNIIQGLEIRKPFSKTKKIESIKPIMHVIEISPIYLKHLNVGDKIKLEDTV